MSRKEKKEALSALLEMVRVYEGEWNANRIVAEMGVEQGLTKETVERYVTELIVTKKIERRGENLWLPKEKKVADEKEEEPKE